MHSQELLHTLFTLWGHPRAGREEIVAFQNRKLRHLIHHASRDVVYYQRLFERTGIHPEDISTADDLALLPITERNDLKAGPPSDLFSRRVSPERLVRRATSGSSGRPFLVRRAHLEEHVINMFRIRAHRHYGLRLRDRIAGVLAVGTPGENRSAFLTGLRQAAGVHRYYPVNCLQPSETVRRRLEELDPDVITGYPSSIARMTLLYGTFPGNRRLRYITCGGESLTSLKRKAIEEGYGVPVFDILGAHECNIVAWECPQTGLYHVCDDNIVAEVVRDGQRVREGERGELVITTLHSHAMPFIRYRLGDVVVKGPDTCPCGQPFSTFREIGGRIRDYFTLPDGRSIHPLEVALPVITDNAPWINQFQMTQETETRFVLRVSTLREPTAGEVSTLRRIAIERLGRGAEFHLQVVDQIPFEASGKYKDCQSLLRSDE
jgi:phenylacetate-CoA ligase